MPPFLSTSLTETSAADNVVKLWSPHTGELIKNLFGHTKGCSDITWSADGVYLASASDDTVVRIWDVESVSSGLAPFLFCTHCPGAYPLSGYDAQAAERPSGRRVLCELQPSLESAGIRRPGGRRALMECRQR